MEKGLAWSSIAISGVLLILFVLDMTAGTPFGGRWRLVDIIGAISCALVLYMSFDVLKDLGFPGLGGGKKKAAREEPPAEAPSPEEKSKEEKAKEEPPVKKKAAK